MGQKQPDWCDCWHKSVGSYGGVHSEFGSYATVKEIGEIYLRAPWAQSQNWGCEEAVVPEVAVLKVGAPRLDDLPDKWLVKATNGYRLSQRRDGFWGRRSRGLRAKKGMAASAAMAKVAAAKEKT